MSADRLQQQREGLRLSSLLGSTIAAHGANRVVALVPAGESAEPVLVVRSGGIYALHDVEQQQPGSRESDVEMEDGGDLQSEEDGDLWSKFGLLTVLCTNWLGTEALCELDASVISGAEPLSVACNLVSNALAPGIPGTFGNARPGEEYSKRSAETRVAFIQSLFSAVRAPSIKRFLSWIPSQSAPVTATPDHWQRLEQVDPGVLDGFDAQIGAIALAFGAEADRQLSSLRSRLLLVASCIELFADLGLDTDERTKLDDGARDTARAYRKAAAAVLLCRQPVSHLLHPFGRRVEHDLGKGILQLVLHARMKRRKEPDAVGWIVGILPMLPLAPLASTSSEHAQSHRTYENRVLSIACFLYEGQFWASLEEFMRLLDPMLLDENTLLRHFDAGATFHRTLTDCRHNRKPVDKPLLRLVQPIRAMTKLLSDVAPLSLTPEQLSDLNIYMGREPLDRVPFDILEYGLDYLIKPQFEDLMKLYTKELLAEQQGAEDMFMQCTFECCFLLVCLPPANGNYRLQQNRCLQFLIEFCLHFGFSEQAFVAMLAVHPDNQRSLHEHVEDDDRQHAQIKEDATRCFVQAALKVPEGSALLLDLIRLPWQGAWEDAFVGEIRKRILIEPSSSPDSSRLYSLLYALYVHRNNFGKAALFKYLQALRLQQEDESVDSLRKQMHAYLAALTAMQLEEATSASNVEGAIWLDVDGIPDPSDPSASPKRELDSDLPRVNSRPNRANQKLSVQHLRQQYLLSKACCKIVEAGGTLDASLRPGRPHRSVLHSPFAVFEHVDRQRVEQEPSTAHMESAASQLVRHGQFPLAIQLGLQIRSSCVQPHPAGRDAAVHGFGCDLRYLFREYARTQASQHSSNHGHVFPRTDHMQLDASMKRLTDSTAAWQLLEEYLQRLDGPHTNFGLHEAVAKEILAAEKATAKSSNRRLPPWIVKSWLRISTKQSDGSQLFLRYSAGFNRLIATLISFNCSEQVVELFSELLKEATSAADTIEHLHLFPSTLQCLRSLLKDAKSKPASAFTDYSFLEEQLAKTF
jgi:hypothetical protein